jgi:hypothetical protein
VFFGVLETTYAQHNARGWLLHFDASLAQSKTPGPFGWDDSQPDFITPAVLVMKEVLATLGVTPDPDYPGGVVGQRTGRVVHANRHRRGWDGVCDQ